MIPHSRTGEPAPDLVEVLLAEQHHRLSNSFQIVASMTRQCGRSLAGPDAELAMRSLETRLSALVCVHRMLASEFSMEEFSEHVRRISRSLVQAFGRDDAVVLRLDHFWFGPQRRLRLALIVAELVTNCLKHSLNGAPRGRIDISARTAGPNLMLALSDSARRQIHGPRPDAPRIVASLAASLGGTAEVVDRRGYTARVLIPLEPEEWGASMQSVATRGSDLRAECGSWN